MNKINDKFYDVIIELYSNYDNEQVRNGTERIIDDLINIDYIFHQ
jgi:hypothetical protein